MIATILTMACAFALGAGGVFFGMTAGSSSGARGADYCMIAFALMVLGLALAFVAGGAA